MFDQMRRLAVEAAVEVAKHVNNVKSLTCIVPLPNALLDGWAMILVEEASVAEQLGVDRVRALAQ